MGPRQVLDLEPGAVVLLLVDVVSHVRRGSSALHWVPPLLELWIWTWWSLVM